MVPPVNTASTAQLVQ